MTRENAFGRIYAILEHACPKTIKQVEIMLTTPGMVLGQYTRQYQDAGEPFLSLWVEALEALGPNDLSGNIPQSKQGAFWLGFYAVKAAMMPPKECMGSVKAAEMLGIDPATIRQQIAAGRFPGAKKNSRGDWLIPAEDVANYRK